jgi:hypothetical protein
MLKLLKSGQTSVILRLKLRSTVTGNGLTGLTSGSAGLVVGTIADNEATTTRYRASSSEVETIATLGTYAAPTAGMCRFKEIDSASHPGLYEFQIDDARWAVTDAKSVVVSVSGATNLADTDEEIQLNFNDLDPSEIRSAIGLSADIDQQFNSILADTTEIKAKTINIPDDPADASDIEGLVTAIVASIDMIPNADANADALLDRSDAIEDGLTVRGSLRLAAAALAGKISGADVLAPAIRSAVSDAKDRITATTDVAGNRLSVTTDVT